MPQQVLGVAVERDAPDVIGVDEHADRRRRCRRPVQRMLGAGFHDHPNRIAGPLDDGVGADRRGDPEQIDVGEELLQLEPEVLGGTAQATDHRLAEVEVRGRHLAHHRPHTIGHVAVRERAAHVDPDREHFSSPAPSA